MVSVVSSNSSKHYYFLDSKKNICVENLSFFERIVRFVTSFFHIRNYNLTSVLSVLEKESKKNEELIEKIKRKIAKGSNLDELQYENLSLINSYYNAKKIFTYSEVISLKKFIVSSLGNKKLNKSIKKFNLHLTPTSQKIYKKTINLLLAISYKAKDLKSFDRAFKKIQVIDSYLKDDGTLSCKLTKKQKLNHRELLHLEEKAKLKEVFDEIGKMGLLFNNKPLEELQQKIKKCFDFVGKIQDIAHRQAPHKKSGVLIFYDIKNFKALRSPFKAFLDYVFLQKLLKNNVFHASVGYLDSKNQDMEADIMHHYRRNRRSLYSRTFRSMEFNVDRVVDNKNHDKMVLLYGEKYKLVLEEKFCKILNEYYSDTKKFEHLYNPALRKLLVGLGFRWSPFDTSIDERIKFSKSNQCVCSEFALKSLMQCLRKLQDEVNNDWSKKCKGSYEKIEFNHPIRSRRRLDRVTPHEIILQLIESGFGTLTPQAPIINDIIHYHHYDINSLICR